ncbi:hypothetical protein M5D96_011140, partial [Drosophila gunungcola]
EKFSKTTATKSSSEFGIIKFFVVWYCANETTAVISHTRISVLWHVCVYLGLKFCIQIILYLYTFNQSVPSNQFTNVTKTNMSRTHTHTHNECVFHSDSRLFIILSLSHIRDLSGEYI